MSDELVDLPSGKPAEPQFTKPIHSLVVDTGPLIKNDPLPTVLREKAEKLYTIPSVISEIRDAATKSRVETTLLPFLELRHPKPDSVAFVTGLGCRSSRKGRSVVSTRDFVAASRISEMTDGIV